MINSDYLKNLNKAQKEAVMHLEGPLLIVAGAGSGKTKVLTSRIANIIKEKKAFPNQILAVTFTNKAAKEMQNRVSGILGKTAIGLSWLGTFHSICAKLLRKHSSAVGLNSNFTIIDMDDQTRLIKNICKAENIDFATIGIAATSDIVSEITTESTSITLSDASSFPDSGNAYIYDPSGNIILKWEGKEDNTLLGISGITKKPPVGAIIIEKDNLQDIKGVGPFIEEKLNALGIYTFRQIANMNFEIEEQVNVAIEFFPGRVRRDEWAKQAYDFINNDES